MLDRLLSLFGAAEGGPGARGPGGTRLAAAALLLEAAAVDGTLAPEERRAVEGVLARHFGLDGAALARLMAEAERTRDASNQLVRFTRAIKDEYGPDERVALVELLWEVIYADGVVDHLEANLMRRIAGLIYVSDQDVGAARKRVQERRAAAGR